MCVECQKKPIHALGLCQACYSRKRRKENPEHARELYRRTHANRREAVKIYRKQYHQRNKEAFAANYKAWAEKNADKVKNYRRRYWPQWKKRNLERYRAYQSDYQRIRDSRLKAQTVERIDRFKVYERDEGICGICKSYVDKERFTIDHIFPLSKGGLHTYSNVQIAHSLCNSRKGATI